MDCHFKSRLIIAITNILQDTSSLSMNLYTACVITALLLGTCYCTNMVEALQYLG